MKTSFEPNVNKSDKNDNKTNDEMSAKTDDKKTYFNSLGNQIQLSSMPPTPEGIYCFNELNDRSEEFDL
jgi:hypothetical protein